VKFLEGKKHDRNQWTSTIDKIKVCIVLCSTTEEKIYLPKYSLYRKMLQIKVVDLNETYIFCYKRRKEEGRAGNKSKREERRDWRLCTSTHIKQEC
jgi:hypothetical protein